MGGWLVAVDRGLGHAAVLCVRHGGGDVGNKAFVADGTVLERFIKMMKINGRFGSLVVSCQLAIGGLLREKMFVNGEMGKWGNGEKARKHVKVTSRQARYVPAQQRRGLVMAKQGPVESSRAKPLVDRDVGAAICFCM